MDFSTRFYFSSFKKWLFCLYTYTIYYTLIVARKDLNDGIHIVTVYAFPRKTRSKTVKSHHASKQRHG